MGNNSGDFKKYKEEGQQTKITEYISGIIKDFKKSGIASVLEILNWMHKNIKEKQLSPGEKAKIFRKRTADEIIRSGFATGCSDFSLVFVALVRARGIPAKYVETIEIEWLENGGESSIRGHVFAEIYFDGELFIVDPQGALIRAWYGKRYVVYAVGLDSWDIGIENFEDLKNKFSEFREKWLKNK